MMGESYWQDDMLNSPDGVEHPGSPGEDPGAQKHRWSGRSEGEAKASEAGTNLREGKEQENGMKKTKT